VKPLQVVLDTNVLYAALRSPKGVSYQVLRLLGSELFQINLSVPLVLEYEDVVKRYLHELPVDKQDVEDLLDYLCSIANITEIHYLWRPFLRDPGDDMVLELAVAANCDAIVTFNKRDFGGCEQFGVRLLTPFELLVEIGVI
jgi:putative PIN family toxin of toxin-antitoxin system